MTNQDTQLSRRRWHQAGQSMVEFAVVLLVLAGLIFGTINVLQRLASVHTTTYAARAAAHRAAVTGDPEQARQAARDVLNAGLSTDADKARITITCQPLAGQTTCTRYSAITVQISYADEYWAPLRLPLIGGMSQFNARVATSRAAELDTSIPVNRAGPTSSTAGPTSFSAPAAQGADTQGAQSADTLAAPGPGQMPAIPGSTISLPGSRP